MTPTSLITRTTLDGVAQTYETSVLPTDPDTCVLWDCMQVSGCEVLVPTVGGVKQGSVLHRWIVQDAIQSAESVPQGTEGKAAIEAARVWVADPSEENRVAAQAAALAAHAPTPPPKPPPKPPTTPPKPPEPPTTPPTTPPGFGFGFWRQWLKRVCFQTPIEKKP